MPGYMRWKNLYKEEFCAMTEEGYDTSATITHAVMFGIDTDCNGGTAGRSGIEDKWIEPLNDTVHTCVADIGRIGIAEMTDHIAKLRVRKQSGGSKGCLNKRLHAENAWSRFYRTTEE